MADGIRSSVRSKRWSKCHGCCSVTRWRHMRRGSIPPSASFATTAWCIFSWILRYPDPRAHFVRFIVSFMNVLASVLCVLVFYRILLRLAIDEFAALLTATLYAFGTMHWAYSGTLLSEPLATLLLLLAFLLLLPRDAAAGEEGGQWHTRLCWSGVCPGWQPRRISPPSSACPFSWLMCCTRMAGCSSGGKHCCRC